MKKINNCIKIVIVVVFTGLISQAKAQYDTVSYDIHFSTQNQDMWEAGQFDLNMDLPLFDESWNTGGGFDGTESILGAEFGLDFNASTEGNMAMKLYIKDATAGRINNIELPTRVKFIVPQNGQFQAGEVIRITSEFEFDNTASMEPEYPSVGKAGMSFKMFMNNSVTMRGCLFDCSSTTINLNVPPIDMALFQLSLLPGETFFPGMTNEGLPSFLCFTPPAVIPTMIYKDVLPISIAKELNDESIKPKTNPDGTTTNDTTRWASPFLEAELDLPHIDNYTSLIQNKRTLVTTGDYQYIYAGFDVMGTLLRFTPYKLSDEISLPLIGCFASLNYNIFTAMVAFYATNKQEFKFEGDVYSELQFPVKMEYVIKNNSGTTIASGTDSIINYRIGDVLELKYPCYQEHLDITPNFGLTGKFSNKTYDVYDINLEMEALEFGLNFEKVVIVPEVSFEICLPLLGCETISTPEVSFDPPDINIGPLWAADVPIASIDNTWYKDSWVIDDFNKVQSASFLLKPSPFTIGLIADDISCNGDNTASISPTISGAVAPYNYSWSNGSKTDTLKNVGAGTYYLKVTDKNSCENINGISIKEPEPLEVEHSKKDNRCIQEALGEINVAVTGGTAPYSFNWSNGETTQNLSKLPAGKYYLDIRDLNNCLIQDSVEILEPTLLKSVITNTKNPLCYGDSTGHIKISTTGGTPPYHYLWNNGSTTPNIVNVPAGAYMIRVFDFNNCEVQNTASLINPVPISTDLSISKPISCYEGKDGEVQLAVSGGTAPYTLQWYTREHTLSTTKTVLNNIAENMYSVRVVDSNFCQTKDSILVTAPEAPIEVSLTAQSPTCFGATDGLIISEHTSLNPPIEYSWSNGSTTANNTNVGVGIYELMIKDALGCNAKSQVLVNQPDSFHVEAESVPTSCIQETDGSLHIVVSGSTPPYSYLWSNGATAEYTDSIASGDYSVQITDANNCVVSKTYQVASGAEDCVEIPSAFTPNDDGVNDTWKIRYLQLYPNHQINIFNKWGVLVFTTKETAMPWDGTSKNKLLPPATYYYIIDFGDGSDLIKGSVTIVY